MHICPLQIIPDTAPTNSKDMCSVIGCRFSYDWLIKSLASIIISQWAHKAPGNLEQYLYFKWYAWKKIFKTMNDYLKFMLFSDGANC